MFFFLHLMRHVFHRNVSFYQEKRTHSRSFEACFLLIVCTCALYIIPELFHSSFKDSIMFRRQHPLKRSGKIIQNWGQVGTGTVVGAEKQLMLLNNVGKAVHQGYAGSECHLLPGLTSFIKYPHKAWTHLSTYLHTNAVINSPSALARVASC